MPAAPNIHTSFVKAVGGIAILTGIGLAVISGWSALTAGAAGLKAFFADAALGAGLGLGGYVLYKAPDWAAGPA